MFLRIPFALKNANSSPPLALACRAAG